MVIYIQGMGGSVLKKKVALKKLEKRVLISAMDVPWYILPTESPPVIIEDIPDEEMVTACPTSPDWWYLPTINTCDEEMVTARPTSPD